ncbi:MAG: glycosyltransferase, partial [Clostridia bacterium]|nr:glycosyltransferase [Clostridia bacterium]
MKLIGYIIRALGYVFNFISGLYFVRPVYSAIGFFTTRRFKKEAKKHKYAVLVAARNEAPVIGNLLDSIRAQDYPSDLVDIFVVADNCEDNTAEIARIHGAVCYERFDREKRTKGYALQYLLEHIDADYGVKTYEGYFIFDADNLLKKDFITRMNESFDSGEKIITSYRNTKNFDDNWISASYGIHWMRTIRLEHRARSVLHLATRVQGTGYLFAAEIIENGWKYTGFTEDRALCADAVVNGYKISYNDEAEFYDEQPT